MPNTFSVVTLKSKSDQVSESDGVSRLPRAQRSWRELQAASEAPTTTTAATVAANPGHDGSPPQAEGCGCIKSKAPHQPGRLCGSPPPEAPSQDRRSPFQQQSTGGLPWHPHPHGTRPRVEAAGQDVGLEEDVLGTSTRAVLLRVSAISRGSRNGLWGKSEMTRGQHCTVMGEAATCSASIPFRHQFKSLPMTSAGPPRQKPQELHCLSLEQCRRTWRNSSWDAL